LLVIVHNEKSKARDSSSGLWDDRQPLSSRESPSNALTVVSLLGCFTIETKGGGVTNYAPDHNYRPQIQ
jgi:hypothetical protein